MKASNKSTLFTGILLLILAALFSISLLLVPLDFGISGPGHNNFFYTIGNILYTVYGFSSVLIPIFLLVAGLSCFASKWTARKTLRLLTALIPFFTCFITEKICRLILASKNTPFATVKIAVTLITGAMLIIIEYLGTGILADKLNKMPFSQKLNKKFAQQNQTTKNIEIYNDTESENQNSETVVGSFNDNNNYDFVDINSSKSKVFDDVLNNVEVQDYTAEEDSVNDVEDAEVVYANEVEDKIEAEEKDSEKPAQAEYSKQPEPNVENSTSVITQEEFAALTMQSDENPQNEDSLEWKNLPPAPEKLPPEYDDSFDENDPALEFPPKDSKEKEASVKDDDEIELKEETAPAFVEEPEFKSDSDDDDFLDPIIDEIEDELSNGIKSDFEEENLDDEYVESSSSDDSETLVEDEVQETENTKKNYERKFNDKVITNPNYPHGITIHDGSEADEEDESVKESSDNKPKYPSRIQLKETEEDSDDEYVEDETLPFPDFDIEEPAINSYSNNQQSEQEESENVLSEDSYEVEEPELSENSEEPEDEENSEAEAVENEKINLGAAASNVFSQMENDIRKENHIPEKPASAANLTRDELTDFFNAQQEENTPKGKEIASNPPKVGHRAEKKGPYVIPSDLLIAYKDDQYWIIDDATKQSAMNLKQTLGEFNIEAEITGIKKGPVVTMFEILPAPGVKLSKIVALQDNIALSLAAQSVRIVAPIPGKQAVGIEVPNKHRSVVGFREIIEMDLPEWKKMSVPVVLGKDILGKAQLIDLVKTPHMLIAGATGSGKSVCVNSLILSILYKRSYHDVKLILVDPKVVELKLYNNIPHLLTPVITEPKKALQALQYCLCEMERRYALLDGMGVRDIANYNQKIKEQKICTEKLPYIVVIIDEFADLMATSGKELETIVARLTAMSRAVGIHLVLATQRPSVNVITGLIKANIPTRIAFMVASRTDSNIIIDTVGAEKLLGRGDMLYASAVDPAPIRIQGTFVTDQEVEDVVNAVKEYGEPDYIDDQIFVEDEEEQARDLFGEPMDDDDPLYDQALEIVIQRGEASASFIQRKLKIGYNRAARLVEEMEERGIVGPANGSKPREIIHIP